MGVCGRGQPGSASYFSTKASKKGTYTPKLAVAFPRVALDWRLGGFPFALYQQPGVQSQFAIQTTNLELQEILLVARQPTCQHGISALAVATREWFLKFGSQ